MIYKIDEACDIEANDIAAPYNFDFCFIKDMIYEQPEVAKNLKEGISRTMTKNFITFRCHDMVFGKTLLTFNKTYSDYPERYQEARDAHELTEQCIASLPDEYLRFLLSKHKNAIRISIRKTIAKRLNLSVF